MKIVSYAVAKALKEVGYPITGSSFCYSLDGELVDEWKPNKDYIDAPTYLEVWLWLWREKNIRIREEITNVVIYDNSDIGYITRIKNLFPDPEEAIIAAIEYLVEDNLIN